MDLTDHCCPETVIQPMDKIHIGDIKALIDGCAAVCFLVGWYFVVED